LDVLTSQRSLFESELALARTLQGQLVSVVQLYAALGGGWSVTDHPENNLPDPRSAAARQPTAIPVDARQR
jgi:multidrug efflux system outer membrane protein